eukprot:2642969-Pyramimonas_sp.AAC.1
MDSAGAQQQNNEKDGRNYEPEVCKKLREVSLASGGQETAQQRREFRGVQQVLSSREQPV